MIRWQGFGLLILFVPFLLSFYIFSFIASLFFKEGSVLFDCTIAISGIIGGFLTKFIGEKLHNPETNIVTIKDSNGNIYEVEKHIDTVYGIPVERIGVLIAIISIISLLGIVLSYIFNFLKGLFT